MERKGPIGNSTAGASDEIQAKNGTGINEITEANQRTSNILGSQQQDPILDPGRMGIPTKKLPFKSRRQIPLTQKVKKKPKRGSWPAGEEAMGLDYKLGGQRNEETLRRSAVLTGGEMEVDDR
ncbi:hypothetical protein R1flu_025822 [Riccia fluitans]|uniref:Uncharacterized protein n=1 Tax=Riccia fluitans TaxID=41844 RepID=A0ABD1XYU3_9MARC